MTPYEQEEVKEPTAQPVGEVPQMREEVPEHLRKDPAFMDYAAGKWGSHSLPQIREGYEAYVEEIRRAAEARAAVAVANALASPGRLAGGGNWPGTATLTRRRMMSMSHERRAELYETHPELYDRLMHD